MFKRILIPMDDNELGQDALEPGLDLARLSGGEVTLLYAIESPPAGELGWDSRPYKYLEQRGVACKAEASRVLRQALAEAESKGIRARALLVEQYPVPAILEVAKEHDLVVMPTHGRRGIERVLMGSVTDKVLHNCSTSVLVVRPAE